jgi:hypothetical protein
VGRLIEEDSLKVGGVTYFAALTLALIAGVMMLSCEPLRKGEMRKVTAWGIWAAPLGQPIGIGYWHSERGDDVEGERSAKPPVASIP